MWLCGYVAMWRYGYVVKNKHGVICAGPSVNPGEIIAVWSDKSRGDHGISGAVTVSLLRNGAEAGFDREANTTQSQILFSGYIFIAGHFTAACSEYLGFLLPQTRVIHLY